MTGQEDIEARMATDAVLLLAASNELGLLVASHFPPMVTF